MRVEVWAHSFLPSGMAVTSAFRCGHVNICATEQVNNRPWAGGRTRCGIIALTCRSSQSHASSVSVMPLGVH
jgi:hypothetical protein